MPVDPYHTDLMISPESIDAWLEVERLRELLRFAVARIELANAEGSPILSAWLPEAKAALEATP